MKIMMNSRNDYHDEYDVVICGGGFAGQTLARQLKLTYPERWACPTKSRGTFTFDFIDYGHIPFIEELHAIQLKKYVSFEKIK